MNAQTIDVEEQFNELGFEYKPVELNIGKNKILELKGMSVTPEMLTLINNAQSIDVYTVSGEKIYEEQVLRCKKLIFQPSGVLVWKLKNLNSSIKDIIISVDELILNAPANVNETSKLVLFSDYSNAEFLNTAPQGEQGTTGSVGVSPQGETGHSGGNGEAGFVGKTGVTYQYPVLNIFYKSMKVNTANPTLLVALNVKAEGINGGKGGKGGSGGNGGNGDRGSAGTTENVGSILPIKVCRSGPGQGGHGGGAGQGSKGGQAGKGGDGASIAFIGPRPTFSKIENIDFYTNKGKCGIVGDPGESGQPGQPGGGGTKPWECSNGGQPGIAGGFPNPINLGSGDTNVDGKDGILYYLERSNTDI